MENYLVSIVVPIYKVPECYLRQCIESCINQTLKEIEIILVDDGSPDDCGKICDEYAAKDKRVKVIHKQNGGLAAARNSGLNAVSGETMMFLDGDDFLDLECCSLCYKALKEKQVELVMFDEIVEYKNSSKRIHSIKNNPQGLNLYKYKVEDDGWLFNAEGCKELQLRVLNFEGRIAMVFQKLMLTAFLRKNNVRHVDSLRQGMEGFVFNIQLFNHAKRVYYMPRLLYHYTYNTQSITHKPSERNYYLCVECLEWINEYIRHCEWHEKLHKELLIRTLFLIVNTAISCYFSPMLGLKYNESVVKMKSFLEQPIVNKSLKEGNRSRLDIQRKIVLWLITNRLWLIVYVLGIMRKKQLDMR